MWDNPFYSNPAVDLLERKRIAAKKKHNATCARNRAKRKNKRK